MEWEAVIGLEIHVQLLTKSKLFSGASTAYGAEPNSQASIIDLGFPGVLPVVNEEAVKMAIKFGLAIQAEIARKSVFARKHYFYPDLPKGYQISQYELPILKNGRLKIEVDGREKTVGITRAHLEEDAGKLLHEDFEGMSGVDFNRAGVPLIEVVSAPDLRSPEEAVAYMKRLHQLVVYLGICDGNMQEGSFRCDANVSVRPKGSEALGTRAEIKNVNSFRFVERALRYEIERQIEVLESGGEVVQETRLYDPDLDETRPMRTKEEAHDYRYFPCPDLLPLVIGDEMIEEVRATLPELPDAKKKRFQEQYGLKSYDAEVLTSSRELADYYERVVASGAEPKKAANWVMVELLGALKKAGLEVSQSPISPERLAGLLKRIEDGTLSGRVAKEVFEKMWASGQEADQIIEEEGLKQISDPKQIEALVEKVLAENPKQRQQYLAGKEKLFGFFVGQIMKATRGQANPQMVNEILRQKLKERPS